jgi:hypothetical protein
MKSIKLKIKEMLRLHLFFKLFHQFPLCLIFTSKWPFSMKRLISVTLSHNCCQNISHILHHDAFQWLDARNLSKLSKSECFGFFDIHIKWQKFLMVAWLCKYGNLTSYKDRSHAWWLFTSDFLRRVHMWHYET